MERISGRAMGSEVNISGRGAEAAWAEILRLEALLTRFRPSPLTRLNAHGFLDDPPPELVGAIEHALEVAEKTAGIVTPTVLGALEHAGYAGSLGEAPPSPRAGEAPPVPDWRGIEVSRRRIRLPEGVRLDLGGTAKTWIAQQAAGKLSGPFVLDAGGDVLLRLDEPTEVALEHPGGEPLGIELPAGVWGVATSSLLKRAWPGGHHLIDPRSGKPAQSPFVQATAVAEAAVWAEVWSKLALLAPERLPPDAWVLAFDARGQAYRWAGFAFIEERL